MSHVRFGRVHAHRQRGEKAVWRTAEERATGNRGRSARRCNHSRGADSGHRFFQLGGHGLDRRVRSPKTASASIWAQIVNERRRSAGLSPELTRAANRNGPPRQSTTSEDQLVQESTAEHLDGGLSEALVQRRARWEDVERADLRCGAPEHWSSGGHGRTQTTSLGHGSQAPAWWACFCRRLRVPVVLIQAASSGRGRLPTGEQTKQVREH